MGEVGIMTIDAPRIGVPRVLVVGLVDGFVVHVNGERSLLCTDVEGDGRGLKIWEFRYPLRGGATN